MARRSCSVPEQALVAPAIRLYEEAIRVAPGFALAYARLGDAHGSLYWFGYDPTPERLRQQQAAVEQADRLAPDLPEMHEATLSRSRADVPCQRRHAAAGTPYRRSVALAPDTSAR